MFGGLINYLKQKKVNDEFKPPSEPAPAIERKVPIVMNEFKQGSLHSGSDKGPLVHNPKQAIAIALSEQRKANKGGYK